MSLYEKRGVSAQKQEVHAAIKSLDPGLFPYSFCKAYPDFLGGSPEYVNIIHADGAGTKSVLAYLYWKETGDISVWRGIAVDAIVMNLDDLLCAGVHNNIIFSSTIDRNKHRIPGEVLSEIIEGSREFTASLNHWGIGINYLGGETADVGDVVRTVTVNGTMAVRWPANKIVTNTNITKGDVIVGLASFGQSVYEATYNSGIGSNGLTSARHDLLSKYYAEAFPYSCDDATDEQVVYTGPFRLTDEPVDGFPDVGKLLLSPTRTFAPFLKQVLEERFEEVHGLVHCSGGGQTKCAKFVAAGLGVEKDNLFLAPPVFQLIQQSSGASLSEMMQVFNMGCRLELYCAEKSANDFISLARSMGIDAQVIGRVVPQQNHKVRISHEGETMLF